jgi:hypothetical protein
MVTCSVFSSKEEVLKIMHSFLFERDYKNIVLDKEKAMLTAQRRDSIFSKKFSARFIIKSKSESVCDIEITVNPSHQVPSLEDAKKEEKIRSRIYFYF